MANSDAEEFRQLAKVAQEKKAAAARRLLEKEKAAADLKRRQANALRAEKAAAAQKAREQAAAQKAQDEKIEHLLELSFEAAKANLTYIETPLLPDQIAKRLRLLGLVTSTSESHESKRSKALARDSMVQVGEFKSLVTDFRKRFTSYLNQLGAASEVAVLQNALFRIEPDNFWSEFDNFQSTTIAFSEQRVLAVERQLLAASERIDRAKEMQGLCESKISQATKHIASASGAPSLSGVALLHWRMNTDLPKVPIQSNPEFRNYFLETVDMALDGCSEMVFTERWYNMTRALEKHKVGWELSQNSEFHKCMEEKIAEYIRLNEISADEKQELIAKLEHTELPALQAALAAVKDEYKQLKKIGTTLGLLVREMKSHLSTLRRDAEVQRKSIIRIRAEFEDLKLCPPSISTISWSLKRESSLSSSMDSSSFVDKLRFISGPQWDGMYTAIKATAKRAAVAGEVTCNIIYTVSSDNALQLAIGKQKPTIPCISPAEFCTVLQARSGMQCKVLKSTKTQAGTIQLAW